MDPKANFPSTYHSIKYYNKFKTKLSINYTLKFEGIYFNTTGWSERIMNRKITFPVTPKEKRVGKSANQAVLFLWCFSGKSQLAGTLSGLPTFFADWLTDYGQREIIIQTWENLFRNLSTADSLIPRERAFWYHFKRDFLSCILLGRKIFFSQ